jgi:recombinational DNA repair protein (RecF pathway)
MDPLAEPIANVLRASPSHAYCFPCLAITLATPEPALREAAQGLILQEGFEVGDKQCANCQRFQKVVWFSASLDRPRCGLCRTPILPAAARTTANGIPYHLDCWDRKVRESEKRAKRAPSITRG